MNETMKRFKKKPEFFPFSVRQETWRPNNIGGFWGFFLQLATFLLILLPTVVWLKGGAIVVLLSAIFCYFGVGHTILYFNFPLSLLINSLYTKIMQEAAPTQNTPNRLRRAEWVLSQRSDEVLLILEKTCDVHNIQAVKRTAESMGVQNLWVIRPSYHKNGTAESESATSPAPAPTDDTPPFNIINTFRAFLKQNHPESMPAYNAEKVSSNGGGDIWRATCTVNGVCYVGGADFSKKVAMRKAAETALKVLDSSYVPIAATVVVAGQSERQKEEHITNSTALSRGADRWLSVKEFDTTGSCIAAAKELGYTLWSTSLCEHAVPLEVDTPYEMLPGKLALVIGSEAAGVSKEMIAASEQCVYLPMYGFMESLNLSVAAALLLQRIFDVKVRGANRGTLSTETKCALRKRWWSQLASTDTAAKKLAPFEREFLSGRCPPLSDSRESRNDTKSVSKRFERANPGHVEGNMNSVGGK